MLYKDVDRVPLIDILLRYADIPVEYKEDKQIDKFKNEIYRILKFETKSILDPQIMNDLIFDSKII